MTKIIKNPTLFVDIDGTIIKYRKFSELGESTITPIQDVIDFINELLIILRLSNSVDLRV